jgi:hypothetical protein
VPNGTAAYAAWRRSYDVRFCQDDEQYVASTRHKSACVFVWVFDDVFVRVCLQVSTTYQFALAPFSLWARHTCSGAIASSAGGAKTSKLHSRRPSIACCSTEEDIGAATDPAVWLGEELSHCEPRRARGVALSRLAEGVTTELRCQRGVVPVTS